MIVYIIHNHKGRRCLITDIHSRTETSFAATYKNYEINIVEETEKPVESKWYATVTHPNGEYIVDGYFSLEDIYDMVTMCMNNIYLTIK